MKPSIPKGTRDFSALEMARRNYIFNTIKKHFRLYGFEQIETPAMENLTTLTGKYGEEGDQLLFKILNSRIHESRDKEKLLDEFKLSLEKARNTEVLTERALRYDLTVPFARYVVMHQHEITFPFKRFQIQPVWRADKPQKGRYREFYQCDADMIGSPSLTNEIELIKLMDDVYSELNIPVTIKINNRKILAGIAEYIGEPERLIDITVAIDKLDKIGFDEVINELKRKNFRDEQLTIIKFFLLETQGKNVFANSDGDGSTLSLLKYIKDGHSLFPNIEDNTMFQLGIQELRTIYENVNKKLSPNVKVQFDPTLARGLNYYTGAIFEVKANAGTFTPSITGGGRYDDLTGIFGLQNMSGVGISFGIDRIYDVMEELNLFEEKIKNAAPFDVLFFNLGKNGELLALELISQLRKEGISASLYPDTVKEKKQFDYAQKIKVPFICVVRENNTVSSEIEFKNMITRKGGKLSINQIKKEIKSSI